MTTATVVLLPGYPVGCGFWAGGPFRYAVCYLHHLWKDHATFVILIVRDLYAKNSEVGALDNEHTLGAFRIPIITRRLTFASHSSSIVINATIPINQG